MKKIFITGGAGFIGHNVVKGFLDSGYEVAVYDSFATYFPEDRRTYIKNLAIRLGKIRDGAYIIRGDLKDDNLLLKSIKDFRPDIVIHLAAIPVANAAHRFSKEAIKVNLEGTLNLINAIRSVNFVQRFVYTSSSYVYGHFHYEPADEEHPKLPIDTYGATKLSGEVLTQGIGTRFGIEYTIIRPSAVYGPTGSNRAVSQLFVEGAVNGDTLKLAHEGKARMDFTYVEDTARGFILAALSPKAANQIFNITRGESRSLKEFLDIIRQHIPEVKVVYAQSDLEIPKRGALDISKAKKLLNFEPQYSLERGVEEYINFVKQTR